MTELGKAFADGLDRERWVIYHAADLDGKCCAAIALGALLREPEIVSAPRLLPMDYGWDTAPVEAIPDGSVVYMLDFSLEPDAMCALSARTRLVWIDHHTPRIQELQKSGFRATGGEALSDHDPAACLMAWRWFEGDREVPLGVLLLNSYDAWQEHVHHWETTVVPFQYGLRSLDMEPCSPVWERVLYDRFSGQVQFRDELVRDGLAILRSMEQYTHDVMPRMVHVETLLLPPITVDTPTTETPEAVPMRVACANRYAANPRGLLHAGAAQDADVLCTYGWDGRPGWRLSLSPGPARERLDCGRVAAAAFGGGGHPGRAGATMRVLPFGLGGGEHGRTRTGTDEHGQGKGGER